MTTESDEKAQDINRHGQKTRENDLGGHRIDAGDQTEEVAEEDKEKEREDRQKKLLPIFLSHIFVDNRRHRLKEHLHGRLEAAGNEGGPSGKIQGDDGGDADTEPHRDDGLSDSDVEPEEVKPDNGMKKEFFKRIALQHFLQYGPVGLWHMMNRNAGPALLFSGAPVNQAAHLLVNEPKPGRSSDDETCQRQCGKKPHLEHGVEIVAPCGTYEGHGHKLKTDPGDEPAPFIVLVHGESLQGCDAWDVLGTRSGYPDVRQHASAVKCTSF